MPTASTTTTKTAALSPVITGLNQLLADSYVLMANTHFAHWNVEGTDFFALHQAFQSQYENLFEAIDEIAERVRALDAYAIGGLRQFSQEAKIDELSTPLAAKDYVAALVVGHEKTIGDAIALRDRSGEANDLETQDLAIQRIQWHQKAAWMLKAFLK